LDYLHAAIRWAALSSDYDEICCILNVRDLSGFTGLFIHSTEDQWDGSFVYLVEFLSRSVASDRYGIVVLIHWGEGWGRVSMY